MLEDEHESTNDLMRQMHHNDLAACGTS